MRVLCRLLLLLLLASSAAWASEEYADRTGRDCAVCHLDATGGGALTRTGEAFATGGHRWPVPEEAFARTAPAPAGSRLPRLLFGFLHFVAAIVWFGTIFYVHLVLRPAYAKGGLPKREMRIAWASILVLAATGMGLLHYRRVPLASLWDTRWGILLSVKIGLFLFLAGAAAAATLWLSPRLRGLRARWQENDGRAGRPAWVRVGETLYDVSASPKWQGGTHFRRHQAGQDLTDALVSAPHGIEKLGAFPAMPVESAGGARPLEVRVLYTMAYVNLFVALAVVVVISLWRWG